MAYSITFSGDGEEETFFLCSISSWQAFCAWAKDVDSDALHELVKTGTCHDTNALSDQLQLALEVLPPDVKVQATAEALLDKIGVGDENETVSIED